MAMKLLLACNEPLEKVLAGLSFPYLLSPKLDGIRGHNEDGTVFSRSQLAHPNRQLQERFGWSKYFGYDGEFITGEPNDKLVWNKSYSTTQSHDKDITDTKFHIFDYTECGLAVPYEKRLEYIVEDDAVVKVPQHFVNDLEAVLEWEDHYVNLGYEGLILRDPLGRYKNGRSTLKENIALKVKRFVDSEAICIGFEERMHNGNEKTLEKMGKAARSNHRAGLVGLNTLGAILVSWQGFEFKLGTGWDAATGQEIWDNQVKYKGLPCTFKYFDYGIKEAPRHGVWKGWRKKGV